MATADGHVLHHKLIIALPFFYLLSPLVQFFDHLIVFLLVSLSDYQQDGRPPSRGEVEVEEQEEEDIGPLVALAPDVSLPEVQPLASADVSASTVFHYLHEVRLINIVKWQYFMQIVFSKNQILHLAAVVTAFTSIKEIINNHFKT